jgi:hypothetical protein
VTAHVLLSPVSLHRFNYFSRPVSQRPAPQCLLDCFRIAHYPAMTEEVRSSRPMLKILIPDRPRPSGGKIEHVRSEVSFPEPDRISKMLDTEYETFGCVFLYRRPGNYLESRLRFFW